MAFTINATLKMITDRPDLLTIPTIVCTDSYSIIENCWIDGDDNPADAFTKAAPNRALEYLISRSEATISMEGLVTRR
ncbi:hypothetical protein CH63R_01852 [Colletotrichum higginsianum IMI 349063]|uniref:Uncharacterized protein n=1 Tax=Colletotrichum higginsianum (strain IMI 349063) TaxID=759273 RepID=A0A1B7YM51_COLHI|nr:hypothetical protein CH63R_01852 [Colletotrichum higginsianum IMI 349063]OBR13126.1 hypothetical protein CH63R_01852 [Colletotrichum higginsianum IMI 349063]